MNIKNPPATHRPKENGEALLLVLMLILIAVALFAALSYAAAQSTRSDDGSTEGNKPSLVVHSDLLAIHPDLLVTHPDAGVAEIEVRNVVGQGPERDNGKVSEGRRLDAVEPAPPLKSGGPPP